MHYAARAAANQLNGVLLPVIAEVICGKASLAAAPCAVPVAVPATGTSYRRYHISTEFGKLEGAWQVRRILTYCSVTGILVVLVLSLLLLSRWYSHAK